VADWLVACGVTTVALASTGGYGIPLVERVERRGFAVLRGDPPQVQQLTGRPKSDVHDCQWRQRLQTVGLLAGAFRPPDPVGVRRSSRRQRAMLLSYASQHLQPRQQARTPMHLKLQHVGSDVTGETGMASRRAMRAGDRDPVPLARLRNDRCRHAEETSATALHGQWREAPLLALDQAVALSARSHAKLAACERQLAAQLGTFAERQDRAAVLPMGRPRTRPRNRPRFDVRGPLPRVTGVDLTAIAGIDEPTALTLSSAIGLDRGRWPTVKQFTAGLGRCPPHRVSGARGDRVARSRVPIGRRPRGGWPPRAGSAVRVPAARSSAG
jgi:transposase